MPWRKFTMEEERLNFISKALDPQRILNFSELCDDNNISTKTGYKWIKRYHEKGKEGLKDLSSSPHTQPLKIPEETEKAVVSIRIKYPKWGPKKIFAFMEQHCKNIQIPSEGSIGNILHKNNLSQSRFYRRHVAQTAPLQNCLEPNNTWMYDFKGWFYTKNGEKCEPLTITDGFSRYLIACEHMNRKRGIDVWEVLERSFLEFGLPQKMRSDNGPPFASLGVGRLSNVAIKLIKLGIIPEWIEPGCPQQNGRHERFHLTLKNETAKPPALTLALQKETFNQFKKYYNYERPHEALGQVAPAVIYKPSNRIWDGKFRSPEYDEGYEIRKVCRAGNIKWRGSAFFISEMLIGEFLGLKEINVGQLGIYYGPILLGKINLAKGFQKL